MNLSSIARETAIGRLLRAPLRLVPKKAAVPILQGKARGLRWIVDAGTHGCWLGSYEYSQRLLFEQTVEDGAVVYDIGAHAGFYTLLASRLVGERGRVVAVEPLASNIDYLHKHLALNNIRNVTVIEAAAWDEDGTASFEPGPDRSLGRVREAGQFRVRTIRLDSLVARDDAPSPTVMKIDVEGAEARVLAGAERILSEARPVVFLSTHGAEVKRECLTSLRSFGYRIAALDGGSDQDADDLIAMPDRRRSAMP